MKKIVYLLLYLPLMAGLITALSSCGDDDEPVPEDPTISLTASAADANRGQQVTITGTVAAPGGLASFTADESGVNITGITTGSTTAQNFTATFTVPATASLDGTIEITFTAEDNLGQEDDATFTISVVPQGAPTISIVGDATADAKRRASVTITLNITAAEGIDELVVTNGDGAVVVTVPGADITDPANFSWDYPVPDEATPGTDIVLNHNVTDNAAQTTATAAVFTVAVLEFDPITLAFTDLDNGASLEYNEGSDPTIAFTLSKDALINFEDLELQISKEINGEEQDRISVEVTEETSTSFNYEFTVGEVFNDEVDLTFRLADSFENTSGNLALNYQVLTTDGASFLVEDFMVNGNPVQRVRGEIDEDLTFIAANDYYLSGEVEVSSGATLTIEPGTIVYAESGITSQLEIDDSGVLMADASSADAIVFTSGAALEGGTQEPGDWAGIRMEGGEGVYSGILNYVRIEYGGDDDAALRLNEIDAATTIDFVQVFKSVDIGVEARGGNVNMSHIFVSEAGNISINFRSEAYTGNLQYVIIQSSTFNEKEDRDFQARDDADFVLSNLTMIGSGQNTTPDDLSAVRVRDNVAGMKFYNTLIAEYNNDGFRFDPVGVNTDLDGDFVLAHSYIFRIGDDPTRDDSDPNLPLVFETNAGTYSNVIDADNIPVAAAGIGVEDFVPDAEITSAFDPSAVDSFFEAATYVGAIGTTDWTLGWTLNADGTPR